jgi:uncharacterized protein (DUF427 family)
MVKRMKATWNGVTLADSDETIVVEGNHYFPPGSVRQDLLSKTRLRTVCPWKGVATYYSVEADGGSIRNAAWSFRRPWPWIRKIRDHVAFGDGVEVGG